MLALDNIDKKLIDQVQNEFPFVLEPFDLLGKKLNISEDEVISRIEQLKNENIIRVIGPIINARKLGYSSTLVAMKLSKDLIGNASAFIKEHRGISHAYVRSNQYNLWMTLSVEPAVNIDMEINKISGSCGAESAFSAPAKRVFKLRTNFSIDENGKGETEDDLSGLMKSAVRLSSIEKNVINIIQRDLSLTSSPFDEIAESAGMDVQTLLAVGRLLMQNGVIRRFGASINHYRAGFTSNAMCCWDVLSRDINKVAGKLTGSRAVSHCYERKKNNLWPYNLYAMIHGHSESECRDIVESISNVEGISDYQILFSLEEIKKTRVIYRA